MDPIRTIYWLIVEVLVANGLDYNEATIIAAKELARELVKE